MDSPPMPPISCSRRGDRANHDLTVPAVNPQMLSQVSAIAENTSPSSRICPGMGPPALLTNWGEDRHKEDHGLGIGDSDDESLQEIAMSWLGLQGRLERRFKEPPVPERLDAEKHQVGRTEQLQRRKDGHRSL